YSLQLQRHRHRVFPITGSLETMFVLLRYANLFLGVDSCCLHAADVFRVPGVALFGPTDPCRWGFRMSPHGRHVCGNGSMEAIQREAVVDALQEIAALCANDSGAVLKASSGVQ